MRGRACHCCLPRGEANASQDVSKLPPCSPHDGALFLDALLAHSFPPGTGRLEQNRAASTGCQGQTEVPTSPGKVASTLLLEAPTPSLLPGKLPPNTNMPLATHAVPEKDLGDAGQEPLTPGQCWRDQPPAGRSPAAPRSLQGGSGQDANKQQEARERLRTSRPNAEIQDKQ